MSNPFEKHIPQDPSIQVRRDAELQHEQEAEKQRQYEEKRKGEFQQYDPLVVEALGLLRDAVYPDDEIHYNNLSTWFENRHATHWNLGSRVSVGLDFTEIGQAQAFIVRYYEKKRPQATRSRELTASLNRESLIATLTELHKPSRLAEAVLPYRTEIDEALKRLEELLPFSQRYGHLTYTQPSWLRTLPEELRFDPDFSSSPTEVRIHVGQITYWVDQYETFVEVTLVVGKNDVPTHYECWVKGMSAPQRVPLKQGALFAALQQMTSPFFSPQQPTRKKG